MNSLRIAFSLLHPFRARLHIGKRVFTALVIILPFVDWFAIDWVTKEAKKVAHLVPMSNVAHAFFSVFVYVVCGFIAIFLYSLFSHDDNRIAWWASMPISRIEFAIGRALPVFYVELLLVVAVVAFSRDVFVSVQGQSWMLLLSTLSVIAGFAGGKGMLFVTQWLLHKGLHARESVIRFWSLPLSIVVWGAITIIVMKWLNAVVALRVSGSTFLYTSFLGFSGIVYALLRSASAKSMTALCIVCVSVCVIEIVTLRYPPFSFQGMSDAVTVGIRYKGGSIWKAELLRSIRSKRVLSVYVTIIPLVAGIGLLNHYVTSMDIEHLQLVVIAVMCSMPAILARGRSGDVSYAYINGGSPWQWAYSVGFAGFVSGALPAIFMGVILGLVEGEVSNAVMNVLFGLSGSLLGTVVGFMTRVSVQTPSLEIVAQLEVFVMMLGIFELSKHIGIETFMSVAVFVCATSVLLFSAVGAVEFYNWKKMEKNNGFLHAVSRKDRNNDWK